jgi:CO/xanthine dehydrogenase FAD-binding subunit
MTVLRPRSVQEALTLYSRHPEARPLAGGTDFMVSWNMGLSNDLSVLDLSGLKEWTRVSPVPGGLRLGALATHRQIQQSKAAVLFPLLKSACATVGALAIQNRGTLGGNIANASPAGDTFPPLAVYEASVNILSASGARSIPFLDVFAGVKKTTLRPGELIASVDVPFLKQKPARALFRKVGTRQAQAISKTAAAGLLWLEGGVVGELRFALGSVATTVRRLKTMEEFVKGKKLTAETIEKAASLVDIDISPIDDIRSTRRYRLEVSKNILRRFLQENEKEKNRA